MVEDQKIDFGALDPSKDAPRWQGMLDSVTERALFRRRQRRSIPHQLVSWARPTLAIAAGLAILTWVGAIVTRAPAASTAEPAELSAALSQWLASDDGAAEKQLLQVLGETYGYR